MPQLALRGPGPPDRPDSRYRIQLRRTAQDHPAVQVLRPIWLGPDLRPPSGRLAGRSCREFPTRLDRGKPHLLRTRSEWTRTHRGRARVKSRHGRDTPRPAPPRPSNGPDFRRGSLPLGCTRSAKLQPEDHIPRSASRRPKPSALPELRRVTADDDGQWVRFIAPCRSRIAKARSKGRAWST